jgi:hypothetical protein
MKTTNDWRRHLSKLVNAKLDSVVSAVQPARNSHYLQRGNPHRRSGMRLKESVCQLWSPGRI